MAHHPPTLDPSSPNPSFVGFLVDKKYKDIIHWVNTYPHDLRDMSIKAKKELFMNDASMQYFNKFPSYANRTIPIIYEYEDKYPIRDYCAYLTRNDGKFERCCQPINSRIKRFNRPYCKKHATVKCYYCNSDKYVRDPFRPNFYFYFMSGNVLLCDKCGSCS